jgi:hypothetical protein
MPQSPVERLARLVVEQLDHQIGKPAVVLQPGVAAFGHCPSQRAQHERGDVVDVVEDVLVGGVRRADVGLMVEIGPRQASPDRFELRCVEIGKLSSGFRPLGSEKLSRRRAVALASAARRRSLAGHH